MRNNPVIALIDMDCFYVQVELHTSPEHRGKPSAVVQYNAWRGGSIIAVSYEAREMGVNRSMRGDEARQKCPDIHLFSVPELRGKADLSRYRAAGADVIKCLSRHASRVERASVDEAYIDLTDEVDNLLIAAPDGEEMQRFWRREQADTEGCHSVGYGSYDTWLDGVRELNENEECCDDVRLALASFLVRKMRADVYETLGYRCSAGIASSKVTAKYACGVHKPNQQTVVSPSHVATLFKDASIYKIRNLGGKLGKIIHERLHVDTMGELSLFSLVQLTQSFGDKTGPWLYSLCRGHDDEGVLSRQLAQSIGCSKRFPGAAKLDTVAKVRHWVGQMAMEIAERVEDDRSENGRVPSHLSVQYMQSRPDLGSGSRQSVSGSRVVPLATGAEEISTAVIVVLATINSAGHLNLSEDAWHPPLLSLGLLAGKFRPLVGKGDISRYLIDSTVAMAPSDSSSVTVAEESLPQQPKIGFFARRIAREESEARCQAEAETVTAVTAATTEASDYMVCEHCGEQVLMWEAPEHMDWHMAQQVQRDINKELIDEQRAQAAVRTLPSAATDGRGSRGRAVKRKPQQSESNKNQRTIDSFFNK